MYVAILYFITLNQDIDLSNYDIYAYEAEVLH